MLAVTVCLLFNSALCLSTSGGPDPEFDPIAPLNLQVKHRPSVAVQNPAKLRWSNETEMMMLVDPPLYAARVYTGTVEMREIPRPWTYVNHTMRRGEECMTVMKCSRKNGNTFCDSRIQSPNDMTRSEIASLTSRIRGSYIRMTSCNLNLPSQKFYVYPECAPGCLLGIASDSCRPECNNAECAYDSGRCLPSSSPTSAPTSTSSTTPTHFPTSSAPSSAPTTSPSFAPSQSPTPVPTRLPTGLPTGRPTGLSTLSPTLSPSVNATTAPSAQPTQSTQSTQPTPWYVGLVMGVAFLGMFVLIYVYV